MANEISNNIGTAQTLRQFIASFAGGTITNTTGAKKVIPNNATDINVIWDGDSYYITFKDGGSYIVDDITEYLPLSITPQSTSST